MSVANKILNGRIEDILRACNVVDQNEQYTYTFERNSTNNELIVTIYKRRESGIRRRVLRDKIDLNDFDVTEDIKELELKLYELAKE